MPDASAWALNFDKMLLKVLIVGTVLLVALGE